jgi:hypothetical protein
MFSVSVPTPFGSFPAALPALTRLRAASVRDADVSALTGLRRLAVTAGGDMVKGLSGLTALQDLQINGSRHEPLARASDLAPLAPLTRLAMTCVPAELASSPAAARLRRLELQSFGTPGDSRCGRSRSRPAPAALAALAALARGAPLLERLRIHEDEWAEVDDDVYEEEYEEDDGDYASGAVDFDHPGGGAFGTPLGPDVAWPSLEQLQVTPWAAVQLAGCTFPRLSRLVARIGYLRHVSDVRLQAALAALAAKARDPAALRVTITHHMLPLATAAAVPGLGHLSWAAGLGGNFSGTAGDWARLAPSLESLELRGPLQHACCVALAALTGLTRLSLFADAGGGLAPAEGAPARTARVLATLPRLAHLRLLSHRSSRVSWGSPAVAAELARCPALRLLEVERPNDPMWWHYLGPAPANPRTPFAEALRAGGCRATVRPAPDSLPHDGFEEEFDIDF